MTTRLLMKEAKRLDANGLSFGKVDWLDSEAVFDYEGCGVVSVALKHVDDGGFTHTVTAAARTPAKYERVLSVLLARTDYRYWGIAD